MKHSKMTKREPKSKAAQIFGPLFWLTQKNLKCYSIDLLFWCCAAQLGQAVTSRTISKPVPPGSSLNFLFPSLVINGCTLDLHGYRRRRVSTIIRCALVFGGAIFWHTWHKYISIQSFEYLLRWLNSQKSISWKLKVFKSILLNWLTPCSSQSIPPSVETHG